MHIKFQLDRPRQERCTRQITSCLGQVYSIFTREQMPSFHVANSFSIFFLKIRYMWAVIVCHIKGSHQRCDHHHHQDIDSTTNNNGSIIHFLGKFFRTNLPKLVGKIFNITRTPLLVKWFWKLIFYRDFFFFSVLLYKINSTTNSKPLSSLYKDLVRKILIGIR